MEINLDKLDEVTQSRYKEFKEKVQELLMNYQQKDNKRFNLVKTKIEQTNGDWDTAINLVSDNSKESIGISQLLAYEYCLASEKITAGKVSFEAMLDKLFDGVQKFRIGNPILGMDDECLYGKSFDDETAIPITSKLYRLVMNAGAQHLNYVKNGKVAGAVFIDEKGLIEAFAKDENGNPVSLKTDGIDFSNLSKGQSLLTNLRQTVFHEWTHNSEEEVIDPEKASIDYEYKTEEGKIYRNYEKIHNYVTYKNKGNLQEPQYTISTQKDFNGNRKKYFQDERGKLRLIKEINFGLVKKQLETNYCLSSGLKTREVLPNGKTRMHNIITEGFVEKTAREMVISIDPQTKDIDEGRYIEYVNVAEKVIESRDTSLGKNEEGRTYADFLMNSSVLKKDLESRTVTLSDGSKIDGLHYISDYADRVQGRQTRKSQFYTNMPKVVEELNLSKEQIEIVEKSDLWQKSELTENDQNHLKELLLYGVDDKNNDYINTLVSDYVDILQEEAKFFEEIPKKLGYKEKKTIRELVQESIKGVPDLTLLDAIEYEQEKQQRVMNEEKNKQDNSRGIGD